MDDFFAKDNCDRCGAKLVSRTMSWFTEECICMQCSIDEGILRSKLPNRGTNYEGCGYIPNPGEERAKAAKNKETV